MLLVFKFIDYYSFGYFGKKIINYICIFFNLLIQIYKQFLDLLNIIYNIAKMKKFGYKKLNKFILYIKYLNTIQKPMIFVNTINRKIILIEYLLKKI